MFLMIGMSLPTFYQFSVGLGSTPIRLHQYHVSLTGRDCRCVKDIGNSLDCSVFNVKRHGQDRALHFMGCGFGTVGLFQHCQLGAGVVVLQYFLVGFFVLGHAFGAVLAHADAVAVAGGGKGYFISFYIIAEPG